MDIKLFICFHKHYPYIKNSFLIPIHVGKIFSNISLPFLDDFQGVGISEKNPYFCELTATYWISKNCSADVVGLLHYRRYLNFVNDETSTFGFSNSIIEKYGIKKNNLENIFQAYDVVLPQKTRGVKKSLYFDYCQKHVKEDLDCLLKVIHEKYPEMSDVAENVLKHQKTMYPCNMIVAKKAVFDQYADWLFDVLFEVEHRIHADVVKRDSYQQRSYGFLAERMMAIFFQAHPEFRIKEVPLLYIEDDKKKWIKYRIRRAKRKFLGYFTNLYR